ncbi:MAG: hypothetical protein QF541_01980 [Lentisphaeria bacterium]|nr:hypothetical protein [Lentisphaeria bacterium]
MRCPPVTLVCIPLLLASTMLLVGCRGSEEAGEGLEQQLSEEQLAKVKVIAKERFAEARATVTPFDRHALTRVLLLKLTNYDLDQLPEKMLSSDNVKAVIEQRVNASCDLKYPPPLREELIAEAVTKFPFYAVGDPIEVVVGPQKRRYKGTFGGANKTKIKIDTSWIVIKDLLEPHSEISFDADKNKQYRAHHVKVNYELPRRDFLKRQISRITPGVFFEHGYLKVRGLFVAVPTIIENEVKPDVDVREALYYERIEAGIREEIERQMRDEGLLSPTG